MIDGAPKEYTQVAWTPAVAKKFGVAIGRPEGQTAWEYLMMFLALVVWADSFRHCGLIVLGDNLAALAGILNLRGRRAITVVTRELAWRRVRFAWRYAAGHLPAEHNLLADALSRLDAPAGSEHKVFPAELLDVTRRPAPAFDELWVCT